MDVTPAVPVTIQLSQTEKASLKEEYIAIVKELRWPPQITETVLLENFDELAMANFRASKSLPDMVFIILVIINLDQGLSTHGHYNSTRFAIYHPLMLQTMYGIKRTILQEYLCHAYLEFRFNENEFDWRIAFARLYKSLPDEDLPRLRSGLRRRFADFQTKLSTAVVASAKGSESAQSVSEEAKAYKLLFGLSWRSPTGISEEDPPTITRYGNAAPFVNNNCIVEKEEYNKTCGAAAYASYVGGNEGKLVGSVQKMLANMITQKPVSLYLYRGSQNLDTDIHLQAGVNIVPGIPFRPEIIQSLIAKTDSRRNAEAASKPPNERTRTHLMTDAYTHYAPAEAFEKIVDILEYLPHNLKKCNKYLKRNEEIEEDSKIDDYLVATTEKLICVTEALEGAESDGNWDDIVATDIGVDLVDAMDVVETKVLELTALAEASHEISNAALGLTDVIARLLGERV